MCGIAGIIKIHDPKDGTPPHPLEAIPETWLDILDESIKHRGPDGQGRFRDRAIRDDGTIADVALVHRRLSIIDHEGGTQPMVHDGDCLRPDLTYQPGDTPIIASEIEPDKPLVTVVFNGCIYNHRELRTELEAAGHVFETDHSDTEVLVHGWREWGYNLYTKIEDASMFTYITWDTLKPNLHTARDFFGQKPLYFSTDLPTSAIELLNEQPALTVFSSNISGPTQITKSTSLSPSLTNEWIVTGHELGEGPTSRVYEFARHGCWAAPQNIASSLTMKEALSSKLQELISPEPKEQILPKRHLLRTQRKLQAMRVQDIDTLLRERVKERLNADVPVACLLSGGVDSSLISAYAQELTGSLTTITVKMPDDRFDESKYAAEVAKHLGTKHHVVEAQPDAANDLVYLINQAGLPFGDSSLLPTYWACRAASKHAGVVLTGDGGDELFVGYHRHFASSQLSSLGIPLCLPMRLFPLRILPRRSPISKWSKASRMIEAYRRISYDVLLAIFTPSDAKKLLGKSCPKFGWMNTENSPWEQAIGDLDFMLPSDYLRKVDLASMASGIETRAPFLDRRVLLASIQLKEMLHTRLGFYSRSKPKALLKQVARKYLPDHIVDRPKQGFAIPIGEWFRTDYGDMRQLLYDHLESTNPFPGLAEAGIDINMKFVQQMLREHDAAGEKSINPWHGRDHSQRLYMMLVLSIWSKWLDRIRTESQAG